MSISVKIIPCVTFLDRFTGAMIKGEIGPREAYWFPGGGTIHSFWMNDAISILFYGENGTVLKYVPEMTPNKITTAPSRSRGVVELAPHRLEKPNLSLDNALVRFPKELTKKYNHSSLAIHPGVQAKTLFEQRDQPSSNDE